MKFIKKKNIQLVDYRRCKRKLEGKIFFRGIDKMIASVFDSDGYT